MRVLCPFWSLDLVVGPCPVSQVSHVTETCEQYVDVLVAPASGTSEAGGDESVARSRWRDELANRRQLASYLATMTDDLREDKVELEAAVTGFRYVRVRVRACARLLSVLTALAPFTRRCVPD